MSGLVNSFFSPLGEGLGQSISAARGSQISFDTSSLKDFSQASPGAYETLSQKIFKQGDTYRTITGQDVTDVYNKYIAYVQTNAENKAAQNEYIAKVKDQPGRSATTLVPQNNVTGAQSSLLFGQNQSSNTSLLGL